MRTKRIGLFGLASILVVLVVSPEAFAAFVRGESLEWCGNGSIAVSGDGDTAVSGECVFVRDGASWTKQAELPVHSNDGFSVYSISSDGNTIVARRFEPAEDLVFVRSGESWIQQAALPGENAYLAGDSNTLLVEGHEDGRSFVRVFVRSAEMWIQQTQISLENVPKKRAALAVTNFLPYGLSYDGNAALIGDWALNNGHGAFFVYKRSGETWAQETVLTGTATNNRTFGFVGALAADGDTVVAGNPRAKGPIWFFQQTGESWSQQGPKISHNGASWFGNQVALSEDGNTALVRAGAGAYVYSRSGEAWTETQQLGAEGSRAVLYVSLSEDGHTTLIGEDVSGVRKTSVWTREP